MSATGDGRCRPCPLSSSSAGFTLIEALVILAVTALVAGLLFPALQQSQRYWDRRAAMSAVSAGLDRARALAIRTGLSARLVLSDRGDGFSIGGGPFVQLAGDVRLEARPGAVTFYSDGSSSGGRIAVIAGPQQRLLLISAATGLVSSGQ